MKSAAIVSFALVALALPGCSVLDGNKVDYKNTSKTRPLEVPPDLSQLSKDARYSVVNGAVSASRASAVSAEKSVAAASIAPNAIGQARLERLGDKRWLVVKSSPENLWPQIKEFWQESGFPLATEQADVGILETQWVENRAKIPDDFVRNMISKVFDNMYSSPERQKFRTRVERLDSGETEIYISHRSMVEVYASDSKDRTVWQAGPSDPDTEVQYLGKLLRKLGGASAQPITGGAAIAGSSASPTTTVKLEGTALQVSENFDRAWRRIGLALDRSGFTVEDRDRNKGLYFVRYVYKDMKAAEAGWLKKLLAFSWMNDDTNTKAQKYQIEIVSTGSNSTVRVLDSQGKADTSEAARTILKVIADDLK